MKDKALYNDLVEKTNSFNRDLAKWLIGLSTGAIVFSIRLITPQTTMLWKSILIFGLGILVISIMTGVKYVRTIIDHMRSYMDELDCQDFLEHYKSLNQTQKYFFKEKEREAKEIIEIINNQIDIVRKEIKNLDSILVACFRWQQRLFYVGLICIIIFGVFNL